MAAGEPLVENDAVREFIALTKDYIELVEQVDRYSAHEFLHKCAIILPRLYAAGHRLPSVEPEDEDDATQEDSELKRRREREETIRQRIMALLGKYNLYAEVFDPVEEEKVVTSAISNDLSETYSELTEALLLYERGNFRDALWDWKFGLQYHYGQHMVDALRAIHWLVTFHMPPDWRNT